MKNLDYMCVEVFDRETGQRLDLIETSDVNEAMGSVREAALLGREVRIVKENLVQR